MISNDPPQSHVLPWKKHWFSINTCAFSDANGVSYSKREFNILRSPNVHALVVRTNFVEEFAINWKRAADVRRCSQWSSFIIFRSKQFPFWNIHAWIPKITNTLIDVLNCENSTAQKIQWTPTEWIWDTIRDHLCASNTENMTNHWIWCYQAEAQRQRIDRAQCEIELAAAIPRCIPYEHRKM